MLPCYRCFLSLMYIYLILDIESNCELSIVRKIHIFIYIITVTITYVIIINVTIITVAMTTFTIFTVTITTVTITTVTIATVTIITVTQCFTRGYNGFQCDGM